MNSKILALLALSLFCSMVLLHLNLWTTINLFVDSSGNIEAVRYGCTRKAPNLVTEESHPMILMIF